MLFYQIILIYKKKQLKLKENKQNEKIYLPGKYKKKKNKDKE